MSDEAEIVRIADGPLAPDDAAAAVAGDDAGAIVSFRGTVRDRSHGGRVLRLEYEAYGPMVLRELERLAAEVRERWPGTRLAVHHRVGTCLPGDTTVVIAAASPHRAEAFEACRHAIERLKSDVPIWKREVRDDGAAWVGRGS